MNFQHARRDALPIEQTEPKVFLLGMVCLALVFSLGSLKARWLKVVRRRCVVGIALSARLLQLDGRFLIHIPDDPFKHGIVLPNFQGLLADRTLWWPSDDHHTDADRRRRIAGHHRRDRRITVSPQVRPRPDLVRDGVSNICSSMAGA